MQTTIDMPLVQVPVHTPKGRPQIHDLATVKLAGGELAGARITRILPHGDSCLYGVRLIGLTVPAPYQVGMYLNVKAENVIDWSN